MNASRNIRKMRASAFEVGPHPHRCSSCDSACSDTLCEHNQREIRKPLSGVRIEGGRFVVALGSHFGEIDKQQNCEDSISHSPDTLDEYPPARLQKAVQSGTGLELRVPLAMIRIPLFLAPGHCDPSLIPSLILREEEAEEAEEEDDEEEDDEEEDDEEDRDDDDEEEGEGYSE